jgi:serine/threonine protein kinase
VGFLRVYVVRVLIEICIWTTIKSLTAHEIWSLLVQAQILTRIHHKNLVSMMGYCKDGEHMALVYEYMPEGTLQEHISGI